MCVLKRAHNEETGMENGIEEEKSCECHMCTGLPTFPIVRKNFTSFLHMLHLYREFY